MPGIDKTIHKSVLSDTTELTTSNFIFSSESRHVLMTQLEAQHTLTKNSVSGTISTNADTDTIRRFDSNSHYEVSKGSKEMRENMQGLEEENCSKRA